MNMGTIAVSSFPPCGTSQNVDDRCITTQPRQQQHRGESSDSTARNRLPDGRLLQPLQLASGRS